VSTRPWIRSGKSTTGFRQEFLLRNGAGSATTLESVTGQSQKSGPNTSVQRRDPVRKDTHRCSMALPTERPRKLIAPDRYGLVYQVAGSLSHSQTRGFYSGGRASYQLLLPLRSTVGAT
jgi:hypothetical protein